MIWPLINGFLDICLLRRSPADLPNSRALAMVTSGLYLLLAAIVERVSSPEYFPAQSVVSVMLSLLTVALILRVAGVAERLTQTWTAFTGCGALISLLVLPLDLSMRGAPEPITPNPLTALVFLFLLVWSFVVDAHIYRHALNVNFTAGFALATLTFALLALIRTLVFP